MKKAFSFIEAVIPQFIALVCIVLDIGDIFNLFNFLPKDFIPMLTLLLVALALNSLTLSHHQMNKLAKEFRASIREHEWTYLSHAHTYVNDGLLKVLGEDIFIDSLTLLQTALNEHTVHFNEEDEFHHHYRSTLDSYPDETFISSITSKTHSLWQDTAISDASARFIKKGGKIQQIFFMKNKEDISTPELQKFFSLQKSIGVDVSIVPLSSIIRHAHKLTLDRKTLIVGSKNNIVWEVFLNDEGKAEPSALITDTTKVGDYRHILKRAYKNRKDISYFSHTP